MDLMAVRGRRDLKPLLLKVGVAFAFSLAGYFVSRLRFHLRPQPKKTSSDPVREPAGKGLKEELRILKTEEAMGKIINGTSTSTTTTTTTTTTFVGLSPTSKNSGDEGGFLLPEFDDLIAKEFESTQTMPTKTIEEAAMEKEIVHLRNLVWSLHERERSLELQLFEYYGLQEQDAAVKELESQLRMNAMEAKFSSLKIESLEAENQRLHALLLDHSRTANELDAALTMIKLLKRKIKSDGEQAKERIAALFQRVSVLQEREHKHSRNKAEVDKKLKKLKDLEEETTNLQMLNSKLEQENLELMRKLELAQTSCSSIDQNQEATALEDGERMRQEIDKMAKEIDQLRTDHCGDVEELVYLRWVNACLRYELRNYQPPPGKIVARDLSKNLSPKSEKRAKQLILEYASSGCDEKSLGAIDFDSEEYPSSRTSIGDSEDTSTDVSTSKTSSSNKSKFFHKLKKLVLGKDCRGNKTSSTARTPPISGRNSERRASISTCSYDEMIAGRDSYDSFSTCTTEVQSPANQLSGTYTQAEDQKQGKYGRRLSFSSSPADIQRLKRLNVDGVTDSNVEQFSKQVGRHYNHKTVATSEDDFSGSGQSSILKEDADGPENIELKKFAEVLKKTMPRMIQR